MFKSVIDPLKKYPNFVHLVRLRLERKMDKVPPKKIAPLFENVYCCGFPAAVYFGQTIVVGGSIGYGKSLLSRQTSNFNLVDLYFQNSFAELLLYIHEHFLSSWGYWRNDIWQCSFGLSHCMSSLGHQRISPSCLL